MELHSEKTSLAMISADFRIMIVVGNQGLEKGAVLQSLPHCGGYIHYFRSSPKNEITALLPTLEWGRMRMTHD